MIIFNIALSSFFFGYAMVYLPAIDFGAIYKLYGIQINKQMAQGILVACVPIGGGLGAVSSSLLIDRFSRRYLSKLIQKLLTYRQCFECGCLPNAVHHELRDIRICKAIPRVLHWALQLIGAIDNEIAFTNGNFRDFDQLPSNIYNLWCYFWICVFFIVILRDERFNRRKEMVDSLWICNHCYHCSDLVLGNKVQFLNTQILTVERTIARGKIISLKDLQARIR